MTGDVKGLAHDNLQESGTSQLTPCSVRIVN